MLLHAFLQLMIPAKFVQCYIPKEHLDSRIAIVFGPLGTVFSIVVEINELGVLFRDGWSQLLVHHNITEDNTLLLRYEGNMAFTVNVFESDGCQRKSKHKDLRMQQCKQMTNKFLIFDWV